MSNQFNLSRRSFIVMPLALAACRKGWNVLELSGLTMGTGYNIVAIDHSRDVQQDALQAAVLLVKLRHLDSWSDGRQANAAFYDDAIAAAGGATSAVSLDEASGIPLRSPAPAPAGARHIYNQYIIRVPEQHRDGVRARLAEANIGSEIYYPVSLHMQECYSECGQAEGTLPAAERAARETIALPIYPDLTSEQRAHVAETLITVVRGL